MTPPTSRPVVVVDALGFLTLLEESFLSQNSGQQILRQSQQDESFFILIKTEPKVEERIANAESAGP